MSLSEMGTLRFDPVNILIAKLCPSDCFFPKQPKMITTYLFVNYVTKNVLMHIIKDTGTSLMAIAQVDQQRLWSFQLPSSSLHKLQITPVNSRTKPNIIQRRVCSSVMAFTQKSK
jgi:hypothetical protein